MNDPVPERTALHVSARRVLYLPHPAMLRTVSKSPAPLVLALFALGLPWLPRSASAQTPGGTDSASVEIPNETTQPVLLESDGTTIVTRDSTLNIRNSLFSYEDCIKDRKIRYQLAVTNADPTLPLEVWISQGQDCSGPSQNGRGGQVSACWRGQREGIPNTAVANVILRIQDIVALNTGPGRASDYIPGTADQCRGLNNLPFNIEFLFIRGSNSVGTGAKAAVTIDTVGPNAPLNVQSGVGEGLINVRWNLPAATTDVSAYNVYCDDGSLEDLPDATDAGADTPDTPDASFDPDAGLFQVDASSPDGVRPLQDTTSSSGASGATTSSSSTGGIGGGSVAKPGTSTACPARYALREGELPLPSWKVCGKGTGSTSNGVTITRMGLSDDAPRLVNEQPYAIAVSATDNIGNPGPLSTVICNTPVITTDFFDSYRAAGGAAGGCNSAGEGVATAVPASGLGLLALALVRGVQQRRKRQNPRTR